VLIISYGSTRNFRVFDKITGNKVKDILLKNNEVLHMYGDFQKEFEHDMKKEPEVKEKRYSLSFHKYMNLGIY
jgi:alkylated DNA repair dioxygenase AlkB